MYRFWNAVIEPILKAADAKVLVEVGCQRGLNTLNLIEYCKTVGGLLHAIDPEPLFDYQKWNEKYGNTFEFYKELSLSSLPLISDADAVLLDGDHNWYTVYHELKSIEKQSTKTGHYPIVFIHDVDWPYGRRDLYYNPENIPVAFRQPYKKMGIRPDTSSLIENGINSHLFNAVYENNPKNGVLTAVEDFIHDAEIEFDYFHFPALFGLGILISKDHNRVLKLKEEMFTRDFLVLVEQDRLSLKLQVEDRQRSFVATKEELKKLHKAIDGYDAELHANKEQISQIPLLENEISKKSLEINKLQNQISENLLQIEQLLKQNGTLSADLRAQQSVNESLTVIVNQLKENEQTTLNEKAMLFEQKIKQQQKEINLLQKELAKTKQELLQSEVATTVHLNSIRYRLGDALVSALKPSRHTIALPIRAARLLREGLSKKSKRQQGENFKPLTNLMHNKTEEQQTKKKEKKVHPNRQRPRQNHQDTKLPNTVDIIVPIYNAYEEVQECVSSIISKTKYPYNLILIDDCSPDERIGRYLSSLTTNPNVIVLKNEKNLGFIGTVNKGLQYSQNDVVMLNSDTRVTNEWLRSLVLCAYSSPKIGTVTPLSNAAGPFSVPHFNKNDDLPTGYTEEDVAELIARYTQYKYPEVPTGNGFCMYIKRRAIDLVGVLDPVYGRGYCEENDFCMRVRNARMINVIDDTTFIYHKRSVSFGNEKEELIRTNRAILDNRFPEYKGLITEFLNTNPLNYLQIELRLALSQALKKEYKQKTSMLFVLHKGGGGTPLTNLDLTRQLSSDYNCYILTSDRKRLELYYLNKKTQQLTLLKSQAFLKSIQVDDFTSEEYKHYLVNILRKYDIGLIHIRHLLGHTLDLPYLAKDLNIPVVMSFHDFYFICPTIQLLDNKMNYCGGVCTESHGVCNYAQKWFPNMPDLKHNWIYTWRQEVSKMFQLVENYVTTSIYTKNKFCEVYPELHQKEFHVIPHGRDLDLSMDLSNPPQPGSKIKIVTFGAINESKGRDLFLELIKLDRERENRLEIHVLGNAVKVLQDQSIYHGPYEREELGHRLKEIAPNFSAIFSIWPETFCHTLTETWAYRLPPFVSEIGTLKDRVEETGAGWLVNYRNAEEIYRRILEVSDNTDEYRKVVNSIRRIEFKDTRAMAEEYRVVYGTLLGEKTVEFNQVMV